MSDSPSQASTPWTDILAQAAQEIRHYHDQISVQLGADASEDFSHLLDAFGRLEILLAAMPGGDNEHDVMNALAAIRGYTEMLQEDLDGQFAALGGSFSSLLHAVHLASTGDPVEVSPSSAPPILAAEPGFILAVDDLQENRELVARYLSRTGHIVVTAASGEEVALDIVRLKLKDIIAAEDKNSPLSDDALVQELAKQG